MNQMDYLEAGFKVFGLHGATNGKCNCGDPDCKALYKHPLVANWQFTPDWSDDQIEVMEMTGQFSTGFGVLCDGFLVVDIDPRNGGDEGYKKIGLDLKDASNYVVATGGGGWHIYFSNKDKKKLAYKLNGIEGIEFKTTGFVVGAGSMHASGNSYEVEKGHPCDIDEPPAELIEMLQRKVAEFTASSDDVTEEEISTLLQHIPNDDLDYDDWISVGMAIHHSTDGAGFDLWCDWSKTSSKHDASKMDYKWHSFGKSSDVVTIGTLRHMAEDNGYQEPVTFEPVIDDSKDDSELFDIRDIDLFTAPGLVGDVIDWINDQSRYPRRSLAVAAALNAIGNIGGMRHVDDEYFATPNTIAFCVAGSSTGKEAIQQAQREIECVAGFAPCIYGSIKSEQEIIRNAIDHQLNSYIIDELGIFLHKLENARSRGGASYLEGVIGAIMSIYSKADGRLILGGDQFKEITERLSHKISACEDAISKNDNIPLHTARAESARALLDDMRNGGLLNPFLSIVGYTTPITFNELVNYEIATNGFIGRSLIFEEKETNPVAKRRFRKREMDIGMKMKLISLATGGHEAYDFNTRVEWRKAKTPIKTASDAVELLDKIQTHMHDYAEYHKETTGLEAVVRRGFEHILKVSMILAMGDGGTRSADHVKWAYALVRRDIDDKTRLVSGNMAKEDKRRSEEVISKVMHCLDRVDGATASAISQRYRKVKKDDIQKCLDYLVSKGDVVKHEVKPEGRGRPTEKYYLA